MAVTHLLRQNNIPFIPVKRSAEIRIECPQCIKYSIHKPDDPKLYYNTLKKKGKCHRCGWKGRTEEDLLSLLKVRDIYNGEIMPAVVAPQKVKTIIPPPSEAIPALQSKQAKAYLLARGLSISDIKKFAFMYCPEGFYAERVIAPVCDRKGNYRTFVSRSINPTAAKKYLYPKGTSTSRLLYNLHFIKNTNKVWIVEGIFDAIHCFPYAVASFGKQIHDAQISLLRLHGITRVYLLWDAEAWQNTPELWERAANKLSEYFFTFPIKLPKYTPTEFSLQYLKSLCGMQL